MAKITQRFGKLIKVKKITVVLSIALLLSCQNDADTSGKATSKKNPHSENKVLIEEINLLVDKYEVSVESFTQFIEETEYITTAEEEGWSSVFDYEERTWITVENANWKYPDGIDLAKAKDPVTQVSYKDVCEYCEWVGGRLPTAEEWDVVAGDVIITGNIWQGSFPDKDLGRDGYVASVAPVGQFAPNSLGIFDMFGNVWEWTSTVPENGRESSNSESLERIIKGGSFLCETNVCSGYIPSHYQTLTENSGTNHLGFRCVYDTE